MWSFQHIDLTYTNDELWVTLFSSSLLNIRCLLIFTTLGTTYSQEYFYEVILLRDSCFLWLSASKHRWRSALISLPFLYSYAGSWTDKNKDKDERQSRSTTNQLPSSRDWVGDFLVWKPPVDLEKSQSFWAILTIWIALVGAALFLQKWSIYIYIHTHVKMFVVSFLFFIGNYRLMRILLVYYYRSVI